MEQRSKKEERPPVFKSWSGWYATVLAFLAVLIILFYLFGKYYQ